MPTLNFYFIKMTLKSSWISYNFKNEVEIGSTVLIELK